MKVLSTLFCLFIVSCSSQKVLQNQAYLEVDEGLLQKLQSEALLVRSPASLKALEDKEYSPRRIYFKALYEQYLTYTQLAQTPEAIEHCPAFHQDFLEAKRMDGPLISRHLKQKVRETEAELVELCEKGVSANYYKFENLITYHVKKKAFHQNPASIFSLLKIPVFQNMYELKTAYGVDINHSQLIEVTSVNWFTSYLDHHKIRETSLVRR